MTQYWDDFWKEIEEKQQERQLELNKLDADKLLMAVSKLESQMSEADKLADDEIAIIEGYRKSEIERLDKKRSWLLSQLEGFARKQSESTGEKTVRMPHGSLSLRKGRDRIEIVDQELFNKIAAKYGLLRSTPAKSEPDLSAVSAYIKRTGEIPPGTKLIPAAVNFNYQVFTNGETINVEEQTQS